MAGYDLGRATIGELGRRSEAPCMIDERVAEGHARRAEWLAGRLERRILAAAKRREADAMTTLGTIRGSLWPLGKRQERALNFIPLLARYGPGLVERMRDASAEWARAIVGL